MNIENKKEDTTRTKKNRYFKALNDYYISGKGPIIFKKDYIYPLKKYSRYLFEGYNEKGKKILITSKFVKENFEEVKRSSKNDKFIRSKKDLTK